MQLVRVPTLTQDVPYAYVAVQLVEVEAVAVRRG